MPTRTTVRGAAPTLGAAFVRALVLIVLVLAAGCGAEPTPAAVQAREAAQVAEARRDVAIADLQADAARADAQEADRWRPVRVAALNVAVVALALVPVVALAAALAYGVKRRRVWMPRKSDGALPFPARTMTVDDSRAALAGRQAADLALASVQTPALTSLTYSPRSDYRQDIDVAGGEPAELPPAAALRFRDLHLDPLAVHLGTSDVGAVTRPWDRFLTVAIAGESGAGKTWTAAGLTLQGMDAGHRVVLCDPHSANPESLAARLAPVHHHLLRPVATTEGEVFAAVSAVEVTMRDRAEGRSADLSPITLVVDEFTRLMRGDLADALARILESITAEGRKLGVRAVLLGQTWSASRTGGSSDLRDIIPNVMLHRMRRRGAAMVTGWRPDDLPDAMKLQPGECYLLEGEDIVRVRQPVMSAGDVAAFAAALDQRHNPSHTVATPLPDRRHDHDDPAALATGWQQGGDGVATNASQDEGFRAQVLGLFLAGDNVASITDALAATTDRRGGTWQRMRRRVEDVIRGAAGGAQ